VAAAAVLIAYRHSQKALLAGLLPHAATDDLVPFPLLVVRRDTTVQKRAERLTKQVMFGLEQRALVFDGITHAGPPVSGTCRPRYTNRMVGLPGVDDAGHAVGSLGIRGGKCERSTPASWLVCGLQSGRGGHHLCRRTRPDHRVHVRRSAALRRATLAGRRSQRLQGAAARLRAALA